MVRYPQWGLANPQCLAVTSRFQKEAGRSMVGVRDRGVCMCVCVGGGKREAHQVRKRSERAGRAAQTI